MRSATSSSERLGVCSNRSRSGPAVAGAAGWSAGSGDGWDEELDARTACPVHRGRLGRDTRLGRGALNRPVPAELRHALEGAGRVDVPVLLLHGRDDRVAPVDGVIALAGRLPRAELVTVAGGRHDVLNDVTHRSVAAYLVQWLERLRGGPDVAPLLTVEAVAR